MSPQQAMKRIDLLLSHVWMVRTFIKHSEEAEEDEDLCEVYRTLYDYMLALGGPLESGDAGAYLKQANKKLSRLQKATDLFLHVQPEVSAHTNFRMAAQSLRGAVDEVTEVLASASLDG